MPIYVRAAMVALAAGCVVSAAEARDVRPPVVLVGPGADTGIASLPGTTWDSALNGEPVINNFGEVVFEATIDGVPTSSDYLLLKGTPGDIEVVLREGDVIPDSGFIWRLPGSYNVNDAGDIVTSGNLQRLGGVSFDNDRVLIFVDAETGSVRTIIREGDEYESGAFVESIGQASIAEQGDVVAFRAGLAGPGVDFDSSAVLLTDRNGTLDEAIRGGSKPGGRSLDVTAIPTQRPPITAGGSVFSVLYWQDPDPGEIPENAPLLQSGGGIYVYSVNDTFVRKQAETNDAAPNLADFRLFTIEPEFAANSRGSFVYKASAYKPDMFGNVIGETTDALFYESGGILGGSFRILEYEESNIGGTAREVEFTEGFALNDKSQSAIHARLTDDDEGVGLRAILRDNGSVLETIAFLEDPSEDTGEGTFIPGTGLRLGSGFPNDVWINNRGQIAFIANLIGPGATSDNDEAVIITDQVGTPRIALRTGDQINVGGNVAAPDFRTIRDFDFPPGSTASSDGRRTPFNDLGQFVANVSLVGTSDNAIVIAQNDPGPVCVADANADGDITVEDPVKVLEQLLVGALVFDFDQDGDTDFFDFLNFLSAVDEGCPGLIGGG